MYVAFIKDKTAVATSRCNKIEELSKFEGIYDDIVEISKTDFDNMPLPSKLNNGEWVKVDKAPHIECLQDTTPETEQGTSDNSSVYDELAAAYKGGVQEA